jgi:Arm domain-containing DNA-binding protein
MMLIRRYKKSRSGKCYWEYKIKYKDVFTNKYKTRRRGGFHTRDEALAAATEMMGYLNLPLKEIYTKG